ncbi:reverse transcriptase domain-containing protein [Paenibacillus naphthalenovorans]|uniref:Uncharacterized protein n=1 Tax=Paenibacillus naphthalenovorans TaxID=162209 RepID=A0A0U2WB79_9BACL|nr:reverse transcriptase domain-containing protein [Paenibacillus naphthalenovorans]ALS24741.1 hypothetical protein IJ22_44550 [Paenibacillus naphthalenovorans]GCL73929.1 hypothetical protein PN4B1_38710 [Paenibacillus naphthalenovorans]
MRSREEHRQPNISQESFRQRVAVKPQGYVGVPSPSPAQVAPSSREDQNELLERVLEKDTFGSLTNESSKTEERPEWTEEGTPQGGPLSPLLANILLDDLDKELTKRGLRFVRYGCELVSASFGRLGRLNGQLS